MLPIRSEFWDECSSSILDSIGYNQMRILHLKLASIIERSSDQMGKAQFVFVVGVIGRELYIL